MKLSFLLSIASFKLKKAYISVNLVVLLHKISVAGALSCSPVITLQICNPLRGCFFHPRLMISSSLMTSFGTENDSGRSRWCPVGPCGQDPPGGTMGCSPPIALLYSVGLNTITPAVIVLNIPEGITNTSCLHHCF